MTVSDAGAVLDRGAVKARSPEPPVDLAFAMPLHGHRWLARAVVACPVVATAAGITAVVVDGRESRVGGALLSFPLPGLGSLVQGRWLAGAVLLLVGLFAWVRWQFRSDAWFPPVVIGVAAWYAATRGAWWSVLAGLATAFVAVGALRVGATVRRRRRDARFRALVRSAPAAAPAAPDRPAPAAGGASPLQEPFLRYFLDFGHRDLDDWTAYTEAKANTDSALRYQMVLSSWALYVAQQRLTPAYRQATAESLRRQAERGRDHRMWSYWRSENLRGAFRFGGDPFEIENVMYSGYVADVVSMYEAMSGDRRHDEPGGYSVTDGRRTYEWDHRRILDRLAEQHGTSPLGGIPCQPGWMFPACQTFSLRALTLGDRVHGDDHSWVVERFAASFRRFCYRDARIDFARHNVLGVPYPMNYVDTLNGQAASAVFMTPFAPGLATEHWERTIKPLVQPGADGGLTLKLRRIDEYDTSSGMNAGLAYAIVLLYAREVGDSETADGLQATLESMLTLDEPRPAPGSVVSNALTFLALVNGTTGLADAHRRVPARQGGVELAEAPYPQVVVTAARADADGRGLHAVVTPGPAGGGPVSLAVTGLEPGRAYEGPGGPATAGDDGRLTLTVDSGTRTTLAVRPVV